MMIAIWERNHAIIYVETRPFAPSKEDVLCTTVSVGDTVILHEGSESE